MTVVALSVSVAAVSIPLAVPVPFAMSSMVVHLRGLVSIRSCAGPLVVVVGLTAFLCLLLWWRRLPDGLGVREREPMVLDCVIV